MLTQFSFTADLNKGLNDQQQGQTTSAWVFAMSPANQYREGAGNRPRDYHP